MKKKIGGKKNKLKFNYNHRLISNIKSMLKKLSFLFYLHISQGVKIIRKSKHKLKWKKKYFVIFFTKLN